MVKVTGLSQSRNTTAQGTRVQLRRERQEKEADHPEHRGIVGQKDKIKIRSGNRKHYRVQAQEPTGALEPRLERKETDLRRPKSWSPSSRSPRTCWHYTHGSSHLAGPLRTCWCEDARQRPASSSWTWARESMRGLNPSPSPEAQIPFHVRTLLFFTFLWGGWNKNVGNRKGVEGVCGLTSLSH